MNENEPPQQGWDGGPILLVFLIGMIVIFLAALLQFTGAFNLSAFL